MCNYRLISHCKVVCAVLLTISVVGCRSSDEPDEDADLPTAYTETVALKNGRSIQFEMVLVPGGTFTMGSPQDEPGAKADEKPSHEVPVADFYLSVTETTLQLFLEYYQETVTTKEDYTSPPQPSTAAGQNHDDLDAMTGPTPVHGDLTMGYTKEHPAMGMTWHNAMNFCKWLSKKTGAAYRLPTEAEWEYACRAGAADIFACGNDPNRLADFAWYQANSDGEVHEVGRKKPNALGLYDMPGNVREWVNDIYSPAAYGNAAHQSPTVDSQVPAGGHVHVARGGDYSSPIEDLRCAARSFEQKWWRSGDPQIPKSRWWLPEMDFIGFRVAKSAGTTTEKPHR